MEVFLYYSYFFVFITSVFCFLLVAFQKASREQQRVSFITILMIFISLGYWLSVQADNLTSAVFARKLQYVGGCYIHYVSMLCYLSFYRINLPERFKKLLALLSTAILFVMLTFDKHQLLFRSFDFTYKNGLPFFVERSAFFSVIYGVHMLCYTAVMICLSVRGLFKSQSAKEKQASAVLFFTIVIPSITYFVEKMTDLPFDLVPFGLFPSELALVLLLFYFKIYDIRDMARETAFNHSKDGLVVFDLQYRYQGCNEKAREVLGELQNALIGDRPEQISPLVNDIFFRKRKTDLEVDNHIYQPVLKDITNNGDKAGYSLWLINVSAERRYTQLMVSHQNLLMDEVAKKSEQLRLAQEQMIVEFANMIDSRDGVTGDHIAHTVDYVMMLVEQMRSGSIQSGDLDDSYLNHLKIAVPLHDIGKISIPDMILCKPGPFTETEYEIMKNHTTLGARIIEKNLKRIEDPGYFSIARDLAMYHHEHWDGTGYPQGLAGEEIPLCARIMALADVFDALVSDRPYKEGFPAEKAFAIIEAERGKQFDPSLTDCFLSLRPVIEQRLCS